MMGECVPEEKNHVRLHKELKDKYGIPQLIVSCDWSENDDKMVADYIEQSKLMFEKAGFINIKVEDTKSPPGADIHEMGGVRMGNDPKTSLLNKWNQLHLCKNVFCNRWCMHDINGNAKPNADLYGNYGEAANHAVEELRRGDL
jgi:choline dehydrogenase-like flavoprotein